MRTLLLDPLAIRKGLVSIKRQAIPLYRSVTGSSGQGVKKHPSATKHSSSSVKPLKFKF